MDAQVDMCALLISSPPLPPLAHLYSLAGWAFLSYRSLRKTPMLTAKRPIVPVPQVIDLSPELNANGMVWCKLRPFLRSWQPHFSCGVTSHRLSHVRQARHIPQGPCDNRREKLRGWTRETRDVMGNSMGCNARLLRLCLLASL